MAANSVRPKRLLIDSVEVEDCSCAYVAPEKMNELNATDGCYVALVGRWAAETVAVLKSDETLDVNTIRVSVWTRRKLHLKIGEHVRVRIYHGISAARKVQVVPYKATIPFELMTGDVSETLKNILRDHFKAAQRPVTVGDYFTVKVAECMVLFEVEGTVPWPTAVVGRDTRIFSMEPTSRRPPSDANLMCEGFEAIGGYKKVMSEMKEIVILPLQHPEIYRAMGIKPPGGILLCGAPGSGKSLIGRAIANDNKCHFCLINGAEVFGRKPHETEDAVRKTFENAESNAPAILFIDELDVIGSDRKEMYDPLAKIIVVRLVLLIDGLRERSAQVVVIGATNQPEVIDPALRRAGRLDCVIKLGLPSADERLEILQVHTRKLPLSSDVNLREIADESHGFVGADLAGLCSMATRLHISEKQTELDFTAPLGPQILSTMAVTQDHFKTALQNIDPSVLRETAVEIPNVTWDDIGGLEEVKRELIELFQYPVEHPEKFLKFGLAPSRGVLLFGPSGCGKTLLAKAIASQCKANFISVKGPQLLSKRFGEGASNVRDIFAKAREASPCVICFDELDSIARKSGACDESLTQLLSDLDGLLPRSNVFIIGTTNRPDALDTAILRPGRLDQLMYIPLPDEKSRLNILTAVLSKSPIAEDVNLAHIARKTHGFSGADIKEVCNRAGKAAIRECIKCEEERKKQEPIKDSEGCEVGCDPVPCIAKSHFKEGLKSVRSSVSEDDIQMYIHFVDSLRRRGSGFSKFKFPEKDVESD